MAGSRLLTIPEVVDRTSIARTTVYLLIRDGRLPSVKIGRSRRVREADLDVFIEDHLDRPGAA